MELTRGIGDRNEIFNEPLIVADLKEFVNIGKMAYTRVNEASKRSQQNQWTWLGEPEKTARLFWFWRNRLERRPA